MRTYVLVYQETSCVCRKTRPAPHRSAASGLSQRLKCTCELLSVSEQLHETFIGHISHIIRDMLNRCARTYRPNYQGAGALVHDRPNASHESKHFYVMRLASFDGACCICISRREFNELSSCQRMLSRSVKDVIFLEVNRADEAVL
jgi:hypothetical protein